MHMGACIVPVRIDFRHLVCPHESILFSQSEIPSALWSEAAPGWGQVGPVPHLINIRCPSLIACSPPVTHLCPTCSGWLAPPLIVCNSESNDIKSWY